MQEISIRDYILDPDSLEREIELERLQAEQEMLDCAIFDELDAQRESRVIAHLLATQGVRV